MEIETLVESRLSFVSILFLRCVLLLRQMATTNEKMKYRDVGVFLSQFFDKRHAKNSQYSVRAFARDIGISSGRASEFLRGVSIPGPRLSQRIVEALQLSEKQKQQLNLLIASHLSVRKNGQLDGTHQLAEKEFTLLPEWQHFAVLNLLNTVHAEPSVPWLANRLGLTEMAISETLEKLCLAGLVVEEGGFFKATHQHLTSTNTIPSEALRNYHRQMIQRALWSIDNVPFELRNVTSIMMTANPSNLYKLKVLTNEFKKKAAELFGEGEATEVYNLCVQIFPATVVESAKES